MFAFNNNESELAYRLLGGVQRSAKRDIFANRYRWDWTPTSQTISMPACILHNNFSSIENLDELVRMFLFSMMVVRGHQSIPDFMYGLLNGEPCARPMNSAIHARVKTSEQAKKFFRALAHAIHYKTAGSGMVMFGTDDDIELPINMIETDAMSAFFFYHESAYTPNRVDVGLLICEGNVLNDDFDFCFNQL
jgi:hypothetical protein